MKRCIISKCVHEFKRNLEGEVLCIFCGDKDDEMEAEATATPKADTAVDYWSTQTSFE